DHLRSKSLLDKIDELRCTDRMEVNRDCMKILNRSGIMRSRDIPFVTTNIFNCCETFAVNLVRWFTEGSGAGGHSACINVVDIRNVQVNRSRARVKSWTTTNHHHRIPNLDLAVKPSG